MEIAARARAFLGALLAVSLAGLCVSCDGDSFGPSSPGPGCIEFDGGRYPPACDGDWVFSTPEEMDGWCGLAPPPPGPQPWGWRGPLPPGPGEMLLVIARSGRGCAACFDVECVRREGEEIVVHLSGGFYGECDREWARGAWALIPETTLPVRFDDPAGGLPRESAPDPCP